MTNIQATHDLLISHGMLREQNKEMGKAQRSIVQLPTFLKPQYKEALATTVLQCRDILAYGHTAQRGDHMPLAPSARQLLWELQSGMTLRALENASGLTNLFPDAHCAASGIVDWQTDAHIVRPVPLYGVLQPSAHLEILLHGDNAMITIDGTPYTLAVGDAILLAYGGYTAAQRSGAAGTTSLVINYFTHSPAEAA